MKEIPLTQGKVALVDDADYDWLMQWTWKAVASTNGENWYAVRRLPRDKNGKRGCVMMHRAILGLTDRLQHGDHIDRNPLNNQRSNLRIATPTQSSYNRRKRADATASKYRGVTKSVVTNKKGSVYQYWRATVKHQGKTIELGYYHSEEQAARAFDAKARGLHGEFANLNFKD